MAKGIKVSFTSDEKDFIVNYFKNTLETNRFCYISLSDIKYSKDDSKEKNNLLKILHKHKLSANRSFIKIRKAIFEVLKEKYSNLQETNFCIHFPEIQIIMSLRFRHGGDKITNLC